VAAYASAAKPLGCRFAFWEHLNKPGRSRGQPEVVQRCSTLFNKDRPSHAKSDFLLFPVAAAVSI